MQVRDNIYFLCDVLGDSCCHDRGDDLRDLGFFANSVGRNDHIFERRAETGNENNGGYPPESHAYRAYGQDSVTASRYFSDSSERILVSCVPPFLSPSCPFSV